MKKLLLNLLFLSTIQVFSQSITHAEIAGEWKVTEIIFSDANHFDKKAKSSIHDYNKAKLHFSGDGYFNLKYNGENEKIIRNQEVYRNSFWDITDDNSLIFLEDEGIIAKVPYTKNEKFKVEFIEGVKFTIEKTESEEISFKPFTKEELDDFITERKIDSVFKVVEINVDEFKYPLVFKHPVIEGCEDITDENKLVQCTNNTIRKSIVESLQLDKYDFENERRIHIKVDFIIDVDSTIKNIDVVSLNEKLSYDIKLFVNNIKVISPGLDKNQKSIFLKYTLPITIMKN